MKYLVKSISMIAALMIAGPVLALEAQRYTVYCADERIEVSMWDLQQMIVRRGNPVCQFASYTSYSSALNFAQKNFGGEGKTCTC